LRGLKEYALEFADIVYYTPTALEKAIGVCPLYVGRMRSKPNYRSGPRILNHYILQFVLDGQLNFAADGYTVRLNKGDMFCLLPGTTVQYGIVQDRPELRLIWIGLSGEGVDALLQSIGLTKNRSYSRKVLTQGLSGSLHQLLDVFRQLPVHGNYFHWLGKFYELIEHLSLSTRPKLHCSQEKNPSMWIRESEIFMDTHFTEKISVQDVADYVGIHRSHFTDAFTKQLGISPGQYLQQLRLGKGKQMLEETIVPITEIALSLGYSELFAFTRAFRNYYGMSPSHYRTNRTN
jgi:AraC-like DNA-binding protein